MDFFVLGAVVDNPDDDDSFIYSDDGNNSFIDDASDISKAFVNIMLFRMLRLNIDDVLKNAHEKAISDLDDANEFTNFSNLDIAEGITRNCNLLWSRKKSE